MVVSLFDLPAPAGYETLVAPGATERAGKRVPDLSPVRQLLIERASTLAGVAAGGPGSPGIEGLPLRYSDPRLPAARDGFIHNRIFAVIGNKGELYLRLPEDIADDLVRNGLCMWAGKNLMTWPPRSRYEFEIIWRILLHAYWRVSGESPTRVRRLWSEWVTHIPH